MVQTGSRPLTRAALAGRRRALDDGRTVTRRELSASAREAAKALSLRPALRLVLSELVAAWGEQAWSRLIVWPSNEYLVSRTGLSERAVRYALRDLVALELMTPKDSANGKRYAIRAPDGAIVDAFGFDLTPLYARRGEWATAIKARAEELERRRRAFDLLTIHQRAVAEALRALASRYPETPIADLAEVRASLEASSPSRRGSGDPTFVLEAWVELRQMVEERFYAAGNDGKPCRHNETNNGSPSESWSKSSPGTVGAVRYIERPTVGLQPSLVMEACPVVRDLVSGEIREEHDILDAGRQLRASIGAHQSAWVEACKALGPHQAALLVLIVAQLHDDDVSSGQNRIRNPGGYFRRLVRLAAEDRYSPEAELLAMRRRRLT
ncbi:plasmid replication protein RepC [Methylobacterium nodulans]|uniref:Replication protein C n=1 Tax=Methylobacterium nodulans (strain LMG 21967 / CNCM I-2342 / ORS 2060) TaxID=460265 RepID=B8IWH1_METNO|nr:plasmid replication protein RepC [Methylobacterium nodulans]ACL62761.1 replication protein C [Methylobacterium nodulans ORS 2060]